MRHQSRLHLAHSVLEHHCRRHGRACTTTSSRVVCHTRHWFQEMAGDFRFELDCVVAHCRHKFGLAKTVDVWAVGHDIDEGTEYILTISFTNQMPRHTLLQLIKIDIVHFRLGRIAAEQLIIGVINASTGEGRQANQITNELLERACDQMVFLRVDAIGLRPEHIVLPAMGAFRRRQNHVEQELEGDRLL